LYFGSLSGSGSAKTYDLNVLLSSKGLFNLFFFGFGPIPAEIYIFFPILLNACYSPPNAYDVDRFYILDLSLIHYEVSLFGFGGSLFANY